MANTFDNICLILIFILLATIPNYKTQYPCHSVIAPLFYFEPSSGGTFEPTDYVDITDVIELKLEALACHASQVEWLKAHTGKDVLACTRAASMYRGKLCSVPYAEAFRRDNNVLRMTPFRLLPEGR